jgi:hypothetical protein
MALYIECLATRPFVCGIIKNVPLGVIFQIAEIIWIFVKPGRQHLKNSDISSRDYG